MTRSLIDDRPTTRLIAVVLFSAFVVGCAPVAYWLAGVDRAPVDHARIAAAAAATVPAEEGVGGSRRPASPLAHALDQLAATHVDVVLLAAEHHPVLGAACPRAPSPWSAPSARASVRRQFGAAADPLVRRTILPVPTGATAAADILNWLEQDAARPRPRPTLHPPAPHSFHVTLLVAVAPANSELSHGRLYLGPKRRGFVLVPCEPEGMARHDGRMMWPAATALRAALTTDRTSDHDVVTVPRYHLSLTLLDGAPLNRSGVMGWSGARAAHSLRPFLSKLGAVVPEPKVDTQVIRFASISERVQRYAAGNGSSEAAFSYVTPRDLRRVRSLLGDGFNLQSGMVPQLHAPLHLVLYAPPDAEQPLFVVSEADRTRLAGNTNDGGAPETRRLLGFSIPRYGGVAIWNSRKTAAVGGGEPSRLQPGADALRSAAGTWVAQLRRVLGVPDADANADTEVVRSPDGVADWELDVLARRRLWRFVDDAAQALASLSKLVQDMSHMAVSESVSANVADALDALDAAVEAVEHGSGGGGGVAAALAHAARALHHARLAEMDPKMAPLKYFPPEHLAAVYLPLIVPLLIPMIAGVRKAVAEVKQLQQKT